MADQTPPLDSFWAVVPAGGAGTRLWPLSRAGSPKFLHDLTGTGRTLIQSTVDRLEPLVGSNTMVVTGAAHEAAVRDQLPHIRHVLAEPSPRDSMAAIGWAAAVLEARDPDTIMGSFAADHIITDLEAFHSAVGAAVEAARKDYLVTIGIEPTFPSTGFGYIQEGPTIKGLRARRVRQFVEKPNAERAARYLATGEFRWNAGMFVVKAGVLLDLLAKWHPQLAAGLRSLAAQPDSLAETWPTLEKIAIDHAVAEPAADIGRVAVVDGAFSWDDVGDFASLGDLVADTVDGVTVLGDRAAVRVVDATGFIAPQGGRLVAVVGLEDVVVVDTPDALLVTTRAQAQNVKKVVTALKESGRADLV
ncbi:mannose-1-phosphate guanylyltransferase [Kribbia dieselivorans]|uniref:mannose-1-phosphate guanylyltransferase n=1 Tax=Kribbia dieselivorans TaxID=331526 RepID=UPI000837E8BA|nr:mannose-1-phosphate guanylyltransferase [Kribbia dieselivorans]